MTAHSVKQFCYATSLTAAALLLGAASAAAQAVGNARIANAPGSPSVEVVQTDGVVQTAAVNCGCPCGDPKCCGNGACGGRDVCCATCEEVEVSKSCWNVTSEKVCVPGITFPWEGCGWSLFGPTKKSNCCDGCTGGACSCEALYAPARCGKVICVRKLEKQSYTCTECQRNWEIKQVPDCCRLGGCSDPNCGSYIAQSRGTTTKDVQTASAELPVAPGEALGASAPDEPTNAAQPRRWRQKISPPWSTKRGSASKQF